MSAVTLAHQNTIDDVVQGLDRWFESTRVDWPTPGYGGPVVHWWNHCLSYRGAGLDWRYEGILDGYLTLWRRSGNQTWLDRAVRAGDDLVTGQRDDGHFRNSRFELNPGEGGTPHEPACDVGLLLLTLALREVGDPAAERYMAAAERNLSEFCLDRLWDERTSTLRDGTDADSFVPNKAATFVEAVLLLAQLTGDTSLVERFALPTGNHVLAMQVRRPGDPLDGAIAQNRFGSRVVNSYFPLYVARCIPALFQLAAVTGNARFADGAWAAAAFVARVLEPDGGLPQVLYPKGRKNRAPRWIAGAGDVVRALDLAREHGAEIDASPTIAWIIGGARADGRIATAEGFGHILPWISRRDRFADEIGVAGWCDKAFRVLAHRCDPGRLHAESALPRTASFAVMSVLR